MSCSIQCAAGGGAISPDIPRCVGKSDRLIQYVVWEECHVMSCLLYRRQGCNIAQHHGRSNYNYMNFY